MKKTLILALILAAFGISHAQITPPAIVLSGDIGCAGFPCLNANTLPMADASRNMTALETTATGGFEITGTWTADRTLTIPAGKFQFISVKNGTTGGHNAILCSAGGGSCLTIPNGQIAAGIGVLDGTNVTGSLSGDTITSPGSTLSVGGSPTNTTLDLNLAHANTWTASQTFAGSGPALSISIPSAATTVSGYTSFGTDSSGNLLLNKNGTAAEVCDTNNSASTCPGFVSPQTTKGDILGFSTTNARIPVGSNGTTMVADSSQALGVRYATITTPVYTPASICDGGTARGGLAVPSANAPPRGCSSVDVTSYGYLDFIYNPSVPAYAYGTYQIPNTLGTTNAIRVYLYISPSATASGTEPVFQIQTACVGGPGSVTTSPTWSTATPEATNFSSAIANEVYEWYFNPVANVGTNGCVNGGLLEYRIFRGSTSVSPYTNDVYLIGASVQEDE